MGDRLLRMQDDIETMQRLMNELEYEKNQYEKEIEKEMHLIAQLECKTEAAKQGVKLDREAVKQQDDEAKLLDNQRVQNMHNYNSLQEACDILNEQEKSLSRHLKEVKTTGQTARERHRATVDHYEGIYKSYKEKYEQYPLAIEWKQKEEELAIWEMNCNEAKRRAEEIEKKLQWLETSASQKAAGSTNEFPIFKNQKEFIIRLAEMKMTFDELVAEFQRKTHDCEELKKFIEEVKAKRQMEERKKEEEEKRIAEERRVSEERSIVEKRLEAEVRRQEEIRRQSEERRHLEEQKKRIEEMQMEEMRQRLQYQQIPLQAPLRKDGFRPETTITPQPAALPTSAAFHQRLAPKILLPTRLMPFKQKQDRELGVFRPPLPPAGVTRRQQPRLDAPTATTTPVPLKRPLCLKTPIATTAPIPPKQPVFTETPVATTTLPPKQPLYIETPVATISLPPKQPVFTETPVATTTPIPPEETSCSEAPVRFTVPPKQAPCPEAAGAITTCMKNLSIFGQTDQTVLMETEDETLPSGFHFPHAEPNSVTHSGFYQQTGGVAAKPWEKLMLSNAMIQEAEQEVRKENDLGTVGTETPMSTDQQDKDPSFEDTASAAGLAVPETSTDLSHIKSSCKPLQTSKAVDPCSDSVMLDDPVDHSTDKRRSNAAGNVSASFTSRVCFPSDISILAGLSCDLVSEASISVASHDCTTVAVISSSNCPTTMTTSSAVTLNCRSSEEIAVTPQVCNANSVATAACDDCTTTAMSTVESAENTPGDFTASLEQPSGWAICGTKTPVIPAAEGPDPGKFIGSSSPVTEFSFEEEMAKLKRLSESPAINLYSGRRMFVQYDQLKDKSAAVHETGGTSNFMGDFGQFESARQTKDSAEKATLPDFAFGNLFTFSGRSDSNESFNFLGSRGNEKGNSSTRSKDAACISDDILKMFGGSDAENATSRKKETCSDESGDIFKMLGISGDTGAKICKTNTDDAGGFLGFGVKPVDDGPAKSQFKFF